MTCTACGTPNDAGRKFCGGCGAPLALACASCGSANPPTMRFCGECGTPLSVAVAPPPPVARATSAASAPVAAPVAERRLVSVLFADLVGFTALSADRDPEDTRELLTRYFDLSRDVIGRYGGTVESGWRVLAITAFNGSPRLHLARGHNDQAAGRGEEFLVSVIGDEDNVGNGDRKALIALNGRFKRQDVSRLENVRIAVEDAQVADPDWRVREADPKTGTGAWHIVEIFGARCPRCKVDGTNGGAGPNEREACVKGGVGYCVDLASVRGCLLDEDRSLQVDAVTVSDPGDHEEDGVARPEHAV